MQVLSEEIIERLKTNSKARYRLCYEHNAHMNTINRWIEENNPVLTTPMSVNAISEELDVEKSEVLVDSESIKKST